MMPRARARSRICSAWAIYDSLGVVKSPGVVNGSSPIRFLGASVANSRSIKLIKMALNPCALRWSRYQVASSTVVLTISDHAASP